MNVVMLIGRLARDPELRYTPDGVAVATFTLAVDRPGGGEERKADFIDCVAWRRVAENVANRLGKGRLVAVRGRLQVRSYEASDGTRRRVWEVQAAEVKFLDRPREGQQGAGDGEGLPDGYEDDVDFGVSGEPGDDVPF